MFVAFAVQGARSEFNGSSRVATHGLALLLICGLVIAAGGCVGPFSSRAKPAEICLSIEASSNLNTFDGEPHVVVVYFYPLQNEMAFKTTDVNDLLNGERPPGMTGDPWDATVYPGETLKLDGEKLPRDTAFLGVLADFYHGPSREVVEADCDLVGNAKLILSSRDLQRE